MITFPTAIEAALAAKGEYRAGGTDLTERRHIGIARGDIVDLRDVGGLDRIEVVPGGGVRVGALVRIGAIAQAEELGAYAGLRQAAGGLATPQIRAVGTLGGNIMQHTRCWYYRAPEAKCLRKGGSECYARNGDHLFHACFQLGPCVAVHASTLGMALLAWDATVEVEGGESGPLKDLFGDGSAPRDNRLAEGALLRSVMIPAAVGGERSAYFRAISRSRAEWPLAEVLARLITDGSAIKEARVAVGGVAPVPLRLSKVEDALAGKPMENATYKAAAALAAEGADPLPMNAYKVDVLVGAVLETLERAAKQEPANTAPPPSPNAAPPAGETKEDQP
jgi:xanthine dehydrogenase YagS FAD-binding subunit